MKVYNRDGGGKQDVAPRGMARDKKTGLDRLVGETRKRQAKSRTRETWLLVGDAGPPILILSWGDEGDNYTPSGPRFVAVAHAMGGPMSA